MDVLVRDLALVDNLCVLQRNLDIGDTRLHLSLLVFSVVILAVLGKVSVGTREGDLLRHFLSFDGL